MPRVGLISDPDAPEQLARWLADRVPASLPGLLDDRQEWSAEVLVDPVAAGRSSGKEILRAADEQRMSRGWDYAVCITDLPLRSGGNPVVAVIGLERGLGMISLPALGAVRPYRRAGQMLAQILDEITGPAERSQQQGQRCQRRWRRRRLTRLAAPIRREEFDRGEIGIRYRASRARGRLRLLSGMVRSNSPWRLVLGMSSALAAAVATSAFGLSSSTIWQISQHLGVARQVGAMLCSVALLTGWMIASHRLWERRRHAHDPEQRVLYNVSTVLTLLIGIGCFYLGLFLINLAIAAFLVPAGLLSSTVGDSATPGTYLALTWGFTTMGMLAGALGASLENDATVRQAAYGYREAQRRRAEQQRQDAEAQRGSDSAA